MSQKANHYDSIIRLPKLPSLHLLYSDVVKKHNITTGTENNPIVIDDFPVLEKTKLPVDIKVMKPGIKNEFDTKKHVQELPLDLSIPKMNRQQHGQIHCMTVEENKDQEPKVKEEPEVSVSDVISNVTYISDDGQNELTIIDDEPT